MKRILAALALALLCAGAAQADPAGKLGLGLNFGSPMGVTAKWWWNDVLAVDGGIGYGNAGVFYADLVLNSWRLAPPMQSGKTNLYVSAGPRIATDDGGQFAVRAMAGMGYWPAGHPVELFAEVGPTFKITPDNLVGIDGGVGFRYYFNVQLSRASP